jgi:hypothetical protein
VRYVLILFSTNINQSSYFWLSLSYSVRWLIY